MTFKGYFMQRSKNAVPLPAATCFCNPILTTAFCVCTSGTTGRDAEYSNTFIYLPFR